MNLADADRQLFRAPAMSRQQESCAMCFVPFGSLGKTSNVFGDWLDWLTDGLCVVCKGPRTNSVCLALAWWPRLRLRKLKNSRKCKQKGSHHFNLYNFIIKFVLVSSEKNSQKLRGHELKSQHEIVYLSIKESRILI